MRPVLARGIADPRRLNRRVSTVQIQSTPPARPVFAPLSRAPAEIPAFTESGHPRSVPGNYRSPDDDDCFEHDRDGTTPTTARMLTPLSAHEVGNMGGSIVTDIRAARYKDFCPMDGPRQ